MAQTRAAARPPARRADRHGATGAALAGSAVTVYGEPADPRVAPWAEACPDPIVAIDADGRVLWGNRAAEDLFGYELDEAEGVNAMHLVHPDDLWEAADSLRTTTERPGVPGTLVSLRLRRADATYVPCELRGNNMLGDPTTEAIVISIRDLSDRVEIREALAASERRYQAIARHASEVVLLLDAQGRIQHVSPALIASTGWRPEELVGETTRPLVHPDDHERMMREILPELVAGGPSDVVELRMRRRSGVWRTCEAEFVNLLDDPNVGRIALFLRDITERKDEEARRVAADERFRSAFENAPIGMCVQTLSGTLQQVNDAICALLGYRSDALVGRTLVDLAHPEDRAALDEIVRRVAHGDVERCHSEQRLLCSDGRVTWTRIGLSVVHEEGGLPAYAICQVEDITGRRRDEERLTYQASHDALTGLPNRSMLIDELGRGLARASRGGPALALLFCDLDRFKVVNDTLGHQAGDRLLVECAQRLRRVVRRDDTIARFGGDEFVVLCNEVGDRNEVLAVADRVARALESPFVIDGWKFHVTTSIGIAFSTESELEPDAMLRDADSAMYRAKDGGRTSVVFEPAMRATVLERMKAENDLRQAIGAGRLVLHYQPIAEIRRGRIVAAEVLVRWEHEGRLVLPDEFLPLAEEAGLVEDLGAWVLDETCDQLARWEQSSVSLAPGFRCSVNLSVGQLADGGFAESVAAMLDEHGVAPQRLGFELTESALADGRREASDTLAELRSMGCGLAIDDFGTGSSALAHLKRFPFDTLKIDASFVAGLGRSAEDEAIVAAIVAIADALELRTVGKGVETEAQAARLAAMGVTVAQGFRFGRPCRSERFTEELAMRSSVSVGR